MSPLQTGNRPFDTPTPFGGTQPGSGGPWPAPSSGSASVVPSDLTDPFNGLGYFPPPAPGAYGVPSGLSDGFSYPYYPELAPRVFSGTPQTAIDYRGGFMLPGAEHPVAAEMRQRYERYSAMQRQWADQAAKDLEFVFGAHWTAEQAREMIERGQLPMALPITYQLVDQAVSMLTAQRPAFQTAARDDSDALGSKLRSDLLAWVWEQSGGNAVLMRLLVFDFYVQGRGVLQVFVDSNADFGKGEVRFTTLNPAEVFPDPNSTHPLWDDAQDVVVRRLLTASVIRLMWPDFDLRLAAPSSQDWAFGATGRHYGQDQQLFPDQIERDGTLPGQELYEVLERYERVRVPHYRLTLPDAPRGHHEVLTEAEHAAALRNPAWLIQTAQETRAVASRRAVQEVDDLAAQMMGAPLGPEAGPLGGLPANMDAEGGVTFHMALPQDVQQAVMTGQVDPAMLQQAVEAGEVQMVPTPGPEAGPFAQPGSTTRLVPVTVANLVQMGLARSTRYLQTRIRVTATAIRK